MTKLSHFNPQGEAHMVNVGDKETTRRIAVAEGSIHMLPETLKRIREQDHKKGDVLAIARIAGIMGAKKTADLIPLCHPLALTHITIGFEETESPATVKCQVTVETRGQTGVEMEAMTATQISLLTIYDMCKAVDRGMRIENVRLIEKQGGKSGHWKREDF